MPTKRRKIAPHRINQSVPLWAERLLAGERPQRDTPEHGAYVAWKFFGEEVPGLPDPLSVQGGLLWMPDDAH